MFATLKFEYITYMIALLGCYYFPFNVGNFVSYIRNLLKACYFLEALL